MKLKLHFSQFSLFLLLLVFSFQSCSELSTSDSTETETTASTEGASTEANTTTATNTTTGSTAKKHSEMTTAEHSDFVYKHADHLTEINDKMVKIKNEKVEKKDHFDFDNEGEKISLERHYAKNGEIHLMTSTKSSESGSSAKHHFFHEGKLIYQFYHHQVKDGDQYKIDDHKTYFKDGEMLKCLEKRYSYKKGEKESSGPYKLVDCKADIKLTKDMEKLLTLSKEEVKSYLSAL